MSDGILTSREGAVLTVTISRPETMNALAVPGDADIFRQIFSEVEEDMSIKSVVLTGVGKAFSSGGNVKDMRDRKHMFSGTQEEICVDYRDNVHEIVRSIWNCPVPVIAAVNGVAVGLGHDVAGVCDIRLASDLARFGSPFLKLGLIAGDGGAWILQQNISYMRAASLLFSAKLIDAQTAYDWGLVLDIFEPEVLMDEAYKMAYDFCIHPADALRAMKKSLRDARQQTLQEALESAATVQSHLHMSANHIEAVTALIEKRSPNFKE